MRFCHSHAAFRPADLTDKDGKLHGDVSRPIEKPIDDDSRDLTIEEANLFMTILGMGGWLSNTGRPDISYAQSRIAQHMKKPTMNALRAVLHMFAYLKTHKRLCLGAHRYHIQVAGPPVQDDLFTHYSDSDHAGNKEIQNKRRSQNGHISLVNGAPVVWHSKVSSIAFACVEMSGSHTSTSSAEAEIYAASNAVNSVLQSSYIAEEMGLKLKRPMYMQIDNQSALAFAADTCERSNLKHIDVRQYWVEELRDRGVCIPTYVPTKSNLADLFTKILGIPDFECLRSQLMHVLPSECRFPSKE